MKMPYVLQSKTQNLHPPPKKKKRLEQEIDRTDT